MDPFHLTRIRIRKRKDELLININKLFLEVRVYIIRKNDIFPKMIIFAFLGAELLGKKLCLPDNIEQHGHV